MDIAAARGVHLVGSIGLLTAQDVFRTCGQLLGPRLKRVPDGEVGGRRLWVTWQFPLLRSMPFLAPVDRSQGVLSRMKLADGVRPEDVYFGELGYAREARTSYEDFLSARKAGHLPERVRFMIAMPTPYAVLQAFVDPNALRVVEPAYTAAMIAEVKRICDAIPHKDLAIQWDVCFEMLVWDGGSPNWQWRADGDPRAEIIRRLKVLAEAVPGDVELGFHLCYGDLDAKHFFEPKDTGPMVDLSNTLATSIPRKIEWIHMPVPVERSDDGYFAPLDKLRTKPETDVYLGLVHLKDGIDGARKRIAAAEAHLDRFGVSTECGFARVRTPVVVERILEIHAEID
jgi:methionine synthase II (cobalamin-independent)